MRRAFAAPLVITLVGAGAPGCGTRNPVPPRVESQEVWTITMHADGKCQAMDDHWNEGCPEGAHCNPPPPTEVECPPGITLEEPRKLRGTAAGDCALDPPALCEADCTPSPVPCPTY